MQIHFFGATRTTTGSMFLLEVNQQRLLFECGLFQGKRDESLDRNRNFPFDPKQLDAVVLSHAHIDHCGNLVHLVRQGFEGPIYCTAATRDLTAIMLGEIDYNGWTPDGTFRFNNMTWTNFADLQSRSPYEGHGRILSSQLFQAGLSLPSDYMTFWSPRDVTLHANSNAVDAGLIIPNITDGFIGNAPDLGAWERGAPIPRYGVRSENLAPSAPTSLTLQ